MERFIRFTPVKGKLEAEAIGFQGPACKVAMETTVQAMGLAIEPGSENLKPEFAIEQEKTKAHVAH